MRQRHSHIALLAVALSGVVAALLCGPSNPLRPPLRVESIALVSQPAAPAPAPAVAPASSPVTAPPTPPERPATPPEALRTDRPHPRSPRSPPWRADFERAIQDAANACGAGPMRAACSADACVVFANRQPSDNLLRYIRQPRMVVDATLGIATGMPFEASQCGAAADHFNREFGAIIHMGPAHGQQCHGNGDAQQVAALCDHLAAQSG